MNTDISAGQSPSFWAKPKPPYPVIDPNPPFSKIVNNFNFGDLGRFIAVNKFACAVGFLSGIKPGRKLHSTAIGALTGLTLGSAVACESSQRRLMGFHPNDNGEVAEFKKQDITATGKLQYPSMDFNPSFTKVIGNFKFIDCFSIFNLSICSTAVGYFFMKIKALKGPATWTVGLTGAMAGFMMAYEDSHYRLKGFSPNDGEVAEYKI